MLSKDVMGPLGKNPSKKVVVFGLSSIESSFSYHVAKGPDDWTHPDQAALTVARSVLNAMEGFLWKCKPVFPCSLIVAKLIRACRSSHPWRGTRVRRQHSSRPRVRLRLLPRLYCSPTARL